MGLVAPAACYRLPTLRALALALGAGALYLVAAQLAFNGGHIWPIVYPMLALTIGIVGRWGSTTCSKHSSGSVFATPSPASSPRRWLARFSPAPTTTCGWAGAWW